MNQPIDIFLLELGNDGLHGIPLSETRSNLQAIIHVTWKESGYQNYYSSMELTNMGGWLYDCVS
jgi:hypothetical protein